MKAQRHLLGVTVGVLLMAGATIAAPRLTIKENVYDFGIVPQNSTISHNFWLYSTGDDSLRIIKVVPG